MKRIWINKLISDDATGNRLPRSVDSESQWIHPMSRKNDETVKEEEPLENRVRNLKTKGIARLAADLVEKNKQQHLDPFALIFIIQSLRNKVKALLERLQKHKINAVFSPALSRPLVVIGKGHWKKMSRKKKSFQSSTLTRRKF